MQLKSTLSHLAGAAALWLAASAAHAACDLSRVVEISIKNMAFVPAHVTVCAGQTIRWTNHEPAGPRRIVHTVTADPTLARNAANVLLPDGAEPFKSDFIAPGQSFETVLTVPGNYKYFCRPHELMGHLGSIKVVAGEE